VRSLIALVVALIGSAHAASAPEVRACLASNDVACAQSAVDEMGAASSRDGEIVALAAETAFYAGRYTDAAELMKKAVDQGYADPWDDLGLYQRTAEVMQDWAEVRSERFIVRYRPGVDAILVDDALETLESVEKHVTPLLGGPPPGPIVLEIYPDGRSFIACSSLTKENVMTTGVVALSKWSRLLLTSPRALGRGYEWKDTVAHEYIHLVVAHHTGDRAPVWLQEGIARYLDNRWRDGKDHFRLGPRDAGLVAKAVKEEEGEVDPELAAAVDAFDKMPPEERAKYRRPNIGFVEFEDMHPSLAKLPSAEMASLAYAQLATLVQYAFVTGGEDVLVGVLNDVKAGTDPREALATGAGSGKFERFQKDWYGWIKGQHYEGDVVAQLPTALDAADASETDPVLAGNEDLWRWVRLGDLLREEGRPKAALVEYAKAVVPGEPGSPLLGNKIAQCHLELGDTKAARAALEESLRDYPEFPLTHKTLGAILAKQGQAADARKSYLRAADLNPFDPEVQAALAELARASGDAKAAARHERYLRILRRGGPESDEITLIYPPDAK
jgi:tetratricopeptide (TPR) repeat protein